MENVIILNLKERKQKKKKLKIIFKNFKFYILSQKMVKNKFLIKDCEILPVLTVKLEDDCVTVAKRLHDFQERRIFVLNEKKFPVGIISIVDINDRLVARGKDPKKTTAKDIMTYPVNIVVDLNDSADEVLKKMVQKDNYYIPVTDKGVIKGLITYANIMKKLSSK